MHVHLFRQAFELSVWVEEQKMLARIAKAEQEWTRLCVEYRRAMQEYEINKAIADLRHGAQVH